MGEDSAVTARRFANIARRRVLIRSLEMPREDCQVRLRVGAGLYPGGTKADSEFAGDCQESLCAGP